jgi:hypothetical protein
MARGISWGREGKRDRREVVEGEVLSMFLGDWRLIQTALTTNG